MTIRKYRTAALTIGLAALVFGVSAGAMQDGLKSHAGLAGDAERSVTIVQRLSRPPNVTGLVWSPDGSKLATFSDYTSLVTIWDASNWHIIREFRRPHAFYGESFVWLPNGKLLTPAAPSKSDEERFSLSVWDPETGTLVRNIAGPTDEKSLQHNQASVFAVIRDASLVAMANNRNLHHVFLLETQNWSVTASLELGENNIPTALVFAPDGRLAVGSTGGRVTIFSAERRAPERVIVAYEGIRSVQAVIFSGDGKLLATAPTVGTVGSNLVDGPVRVWETDTWKRVEAFGKTDDDQTFPQVSWNSDRALLSAISYSGALYVWHLGASRTPLCAIRLPAAGSAVSFAPNGTLAAAFGDEVLILSCP